MRKTRQLLVVVAVAAALVVAATAVVQALSRHSLEPIWTVGWIPAAIVASVASLTQPRMADRCRPRFLRRSGS